LNNSKRSAAKFLADRTYVRVGLMTWLSSVVRSLSLCLSVMDVLWLNDAKQTEPRIMLSSTNSKSHISFQMT